YRWMYGRVQVFAKHSDFFFIRNRQYSRRITWFVLPYAVVQDITFLFAPVVVVYLLYFALRFGDLGLLTSGIAAIALYLSISIWSAEALKLKDKVRLTYYAAPMYVLIYLTTFADYYALTATLLRTYKIKRSLTQKHTTWRSPERKVASVSI
ncbi:MAG TPA: hypothetical protein VFN56_00530, partial [Candidatus Saccharimonadales bacterium]|nr:hypothetical protein [Candidatus Saccharimonadales bacterium]